MPLPAYPSAASLRRTAPVRAVQLPVATGNQAIRARLYCLWYAVLGNQLASFRHINREEERERRMAGMSGRPMGPGANNSPFLGNPNGRNAGGYGAVLPSSSAGVRRRAPFDEYEEPPAYKRSMVEGRHVMELERRNVE